MQVHRKEYPILPGKAPELENIWAECEALKEFLGGGGEEQAF